MRLYMMPMQFWSKLVRQRNNWRLRVSQAGFILIIVCFGFGNMPVHLGAALGHIHGANGAADIAPWVR